MGAAGDEAQHTLHTYFASSCGQRVLIAANLKGIPLIYTPVDMERDEHKTDQFKRLNPSGGIPVLVTKEADGTEFVLSQSVAILEYLEDRYALSELPQLLPPRSQIAELAKVRELVGIVTNDIFPIANSRIALKVRRIRGDAGGREDMFNLVHTVMQEGFTAIEELLIKNMGKYAVGDQLTLADVCLVPQVDMAFRYRFDLTPFPKTLELHKILKVMDAFQKADMTAQIDTPEELRAPKS